MLPLPVEYQKTPPTDADWPSVAFEQAAEVAKKRKKKKDRKGVFG